MKASEILRKLADVIDQNSSGEERPINSVQHAELEPVEVDTTDNTEASVQIPPLQAKMELLKKSLGMDNAYDTVDSGSEEECAGEESDELEVMKQRAGIPVVAVTDLADDEPLDN